MSLVLLTVIILVVLCVLGVPVVFAISGSIMVYFIGSAELPTEIVMQRLFVITESSSYLAIPFFIMAGCIMNYSGITRRMMDLADGLVGHLTGGLAHINVLLSTLMGGISGSAAADAATDCKILVPEMTRRGYDLDFSAAVTLASSLITPIIPPGMGLIVFAFTANVSVGKMFAAGYLPGILSCIGMMIMVYFISKKRKYPPSRSKMASPKELLELFIKAIWALLLPFGIILALRFGILSATEAGAFCVFYSLFVGAVVYRELKPGHLIVILKDTALGTATVMILICAANCLAYFISYENLALKLTEWMLSLHLNKYTFFLAINILFLCTGMLMDGSAPLLIMTPLLVPVAQALGIDLIHLGIVMVFNLGIGNMTPPFGIVLYQVAGLLNVPVEKLVKASWPFILLFIGILFMISYLPEGFVLALPNWIYG